MNKVRSSFEPIANSEDWDMPGGKMSNDDFFRPSFVEETQTVEFQRYQGDVLDLARAFLTMASMTDKKLQKLCYYAKAWYLALNDENLISEPFEAWVHGAVQPKLYWEYKPYGFNTIPQNQNDIETIPEEFLDFAKMIYASYGDLDGNQLERLNHSEMPWINARRGLRPWQPGHNIISEEDMKTYFRSLIKENE